MHVSYINLLYMYSPHKLHDSHFHHPAMQGRTMVESYYNDDGDIVMQERHVYALACNTVSCMLLTNFLMRIF